ncbi:MAG TPA: acetyl-CoA C-acetyltransferase [Candidatus Acidoferrales bacterium]|nr:acetyl-CoA C-acetyltransferase [Candidatus Acidoferrales bacterium]
MRKLDRDIVILSAARTPIGKFGGAFKDLTATELGVIAARAALERAHAAPATIDHVIFGNVLQTSADAAYLARHVALKAGLPESVPAVTVNRLCGSGFEAIIAGAQLLLLDEARLVLVGGTENMSQAPHVIRGARFGIPLGQGRLEDSLWAALTDTYCNLSMAETAENLAQKYGITREQADDFAYQSQMRAKAAQESGRFNEEIVPVAGVLERDEHPRPGTTRAALAALSPVFRKDGVITAGNASGITDGAAALVLSTAETAAAQGLKPIARIVSWGVAGCDPALMGIGPVPATRIALERAELSLNQIDLIEVNEAFACQYLAVEKELRLDRDKVNVNGGAIALGHPLGATGARITTTLLYELGRRRLRYGLGSACIGGGQGIALLIENIPA